MMLWSDNVHRLWPRGNILCHIPQAKKECGCDRLANKEKGKLLSFYWAFCILALAFTRG
jgi:hypothetical protein